MSWKCACIHENKDSKINCSNCGRKKPKYLGIKLEVSSEKPNIEQMATWYLMVALGFFQDADNYLKEYDDLLKKRGKQDHNQTYINERLPKLKNVILKNTKKSFYLLEKSENLSPQAQIESEDETIQDIPSLRSSCYFCQGSLYFSEGDFSKAIINYQKSYDVDPNQVSIYNIAMATISLPVESAGMFAGKKNEQAKENKRKQEIDLLIDTIKFSPFSNISVTCGKKLLKHYDLLLSAENFV